MEKNQCPKCTTILRDDYGMVTCPQCGSILFIDMDGIAHMGQEEVTPPAFSNTFSGADAPAVEPLHEIDSATAQEAYIQDNQEPVGHSLEKSLEQQWGQPTEQSNEQPGESSSESSSESSVASEFSMDDFLGGFSEAPASTAESTTEGRAESEGEPGFRPGANEPLAPRTDEDPLGLNAFANSEMSQAKDGLLLFKILISGIDSKEIRDSIREAIVDQRFAWDASLIMSRISKGTLQIDQLSPVKATILINRIKRLPVKIRWEQYAITQSDDT